MISFREWLNEREGVETEYQKFFKKKLEKYGVESPAELSDEDKKKFFGEIDAEWKGEEETESGDVNEASKNTQLDTYIEFSRNDIKQIEKILKGIVKRLEDVKIDKENEISRKNYVQFSNNDIKQIEKISNGIVARFEDFK